MEKEPQPESLATVTIKPEYPPSEVYSSEPPPAYHKPMSSAVHVARIIAITLVVMSVILGGFMLASAYISANGCRQHELELQLLGETAERLQPEALIQADSQQQQVQAEALVSNESKNVNEVHDNAVHQEQSDETDNNNNSDVNSNESSESEENNINNVAMKVPLQIDFDDLMSTLMEKNQKSKLNCIVEKKRADEIIDHQAKTAQLPFGINLRMDPRYEHITGERIAIICESGNVQKISPPEEQEETIMIQPVMIPIPPQHFQTHMSQMMPQQIQAQVSQHVPTVAQPPQYYQQQMREGMGIMRPQVQNVEQRQQYFPQQMKGGFNRPQQVPNVENRPPFFQHELREGLVAPRPQALPNMERNPIFFQQEMRGFPIRRPQVSNAEQRPVFFQQEMREGMPIPRPQQIEVARQIGEHVMEQRQQSPVPPNPLIHHIIQQIINERIQAEKQSEMAQETNDVRNTPSQFEVPPAIEKLPIPEEILTQINRLPGNRGVIVAVSEQEPEDSSEEIHVVEQQQQQPRENAQEMIMQVQQQQPRENAQDMIMPEQQQQQPQQAASSSEETRPHFVHPRSIQ